MSTPWEGKLRVRREFIGDDDHQLIPIPEGQKEVAHALVHRANAYEGLVEALEEAFDELASTFHALPEDQQQEYGPMHANVMGRISRTLDSLEAS